MRGAIAKLAKEFKEHAAKLIAVRIKMGCTLLPSRNRKGHCARDAALLLF